MNILLIGGGNMSQAIVAGLVQQGYDPKQIYVVDRNSEKCDFLAQTYRVQTTTTQMENFISFADVVLLAIKPQGAKALCLSLQEEFKTHHPLIVSMMAGVTLHNLGEWLNPHLAMVRGMPNTPAQIQVGATGLYANEKVSTAQRKQVEELFQTIGVVAWLPRETDIDTVTALSGSGPAYYFHFMEIMQNVAVKLGLPFETAQLFAEQTAYGAAKLALETGKDLAELRAQVTSKKGTTAAALEVMQTRNISAILEEAIIAAHQRSFELSQGF